MIALTKPLFLSDKDKLSYKYMHAIYGFGKNIRETFCGGGILENEKYFPQKILLFWIFLAAYLFVGYGR